MFWWYLNFILKIKHRRLKSWKTVRNLKIFEHNAYAILYFDIFNPDLKDRNGELTRLKFRIRANVQVAPSSV